MKAAIIGAGFIVGFHADAYQLLRGVELSVICDVDASNAGEMARKYGCANYGIAEDMPKIEKPDLVSVCVPTFLHKASFVHRIAARALSPRQGNAGRHVCSVSTHGAN